MENALNQVGPPLVNEWTLGLLADTRQPAEE